MERPVPLEIADPELGAMLVDIVEHNSTAAKKDRIIVDLDSAKVYKSTIVNSGPSLARNDPCSCGSGKKYKKCCMNK